MTSKFPINKGFIEFGEPDSVDPPAGPTIEISGRATRKQPPKSGSMWVTITGKGASREAAWAEFQTSLAALRDTLGAHAEMGNALPTESEEEVTRKLRTGIDHTVTSVIEITFTPNHFAEVIEALIRCGLPVTSPNFTYGEVVEVTPEMLTAASADARANAVAVLAGVGARIGKLVSIRIGAPQRRAVWGDIKDLLPSFNSVHYSRMMSDSSLSLDEEKLETYDTEVEVTVEYEVIESADQEVTR